MELSLLRLAILAIAAVLALVVAFGVGFIVGRDDFALDEVSCQDPAPRKPIRS